MHSNSSSTEIIPVPLLDVNRGNRPLMESIKETIAEICDSGWFIGGPHVKQLESTVAEICQTEYAIGCASGSDALLLALMAIDLKPGDEVIVPSFTFFASVSAITRLGGVPVFIDIDPITFNLDTNLLEGLITDKTKAIMPIHLFGQCADMTAVCSIAKQHGLRVIEDSAQAIGATWNDEAACSMGDIGCISFYPTKNLGGFGDAGMVATNDEELADRIRLLANHGMKPRYYHSEVGINSRLDAIQAAVLNIKIQDLRRFAQLRGHNAERYRKLLTGKGMAGTITLPESMPESGHVWNQYTIRIPNGRRDEVRSTLAEMKIGSEIYYPVPMHQQECFQFLGYETGSLPETEKAAAEVLSLPIFPELETREIESVAEGLSLAMFGQQALQRRVA